jgi:hypothetical protein
MAANTAEFRIIVNSDGLVTGLKQVTAFGNETQKAGKKAKEAGDASDYLNYRMNQGVVGASNASRSFAKLNQSIGNGGGGLIQAYATLAANAFAVSAAFNALRSAQQAQQVLEGLEAQGARTGITLTVAAERLREVVGFGLSAQETMAATAQFSAAGFSTTELERLGEVAQNTSLALGRNLPDSIDRLIKGTTKLEPELLDELGIMTKLGDATAAYALQTGKNANALTQFERRQAFLNAVLAEGELKFGGISEKVETNPYDKLAASFDNLTKSTLGFLNNTLGVSNFVGFLSENTNALIGVLLLFASTIQKNLLGSLSDLTAGSIRAANAAKVLAEEERKASKEKLDGLVAEKAAGVEKQRNLTLYEKTPKAVKNLTQAMREGTATQEEYDRALKTMDRSLTQHNVLLEKAKSNNEDFSEREKVIASLETQKKVIEDLKNSEQNYIDQVQKAKLETLANENKALALTRVAKAETIASNAIQSASELKLKTSARELILATKEYSAALKELRAAKLADTTATNSMVVRNNLLATTTNALSTAKFFLGTAIKSLFGAFLRLIPVVGTLFFAFDLLKSGYEFLYERANPNTVAATKELEKAQEELGKVLENQIQALEHYNKLQGSTAAVSAVTTQSILNEANAMVELANSYAKVVEANQKRRDAEKKDEGSMRIGRRESPQSRIAGRFGVSEELASSGLLNAAVLEDQGTKVNQIINKFAKIIGKGGASTEVTQFAQTLDVALKRLGPQGLDKALRSVGSSLTQFNKLNRVAQEQLLAKALLNETKAFQTVIVAVEGFTSAVSQGETAAAKFFKDAIPSTPFDDVVTSLTSINSNLRTLAREGKTATQQMNLLTSIGPELQKFLSTGDVALIEGYKEATITVANLQNKQEALAKENKKLSEEDTKSLVTARAKVGQAGQLLEKLKPGLQLAEAENQQRQATIALAKAQAGVEQARLSKYSQFLDAGAAGLKAQLDTQRRINGLNVAGLSVQKSIIDAQLTLERSKIAGMQTTLEEQKALREKFLLEREITLEITKQGEASLRNAVTRGSVTLAEREEFEKIQKRVVEQEEAITAAKAAQRTVQLQSKALALQIAAATQSNLTKEQELARLKLASVQQQNREISRQDQLSKQVLQNEVLRIKLRGAEEGNVQQVFSQNTGRPVTRGTVDTELDVARAELDAGLKSIETLTNSKIAELTDQRRIAESMLTTARLGERAGIREKIEEYKQQEEFERKSRDNTKENLNLQYELRLIELAGLSDKRAALQLQQQIFQATLKELETRQELARAGFDLATSQRSIFASATGAELQNEEVRAADFALRRAEESAETRKNAIALEYDLLEAQRAMEQARMERVSAELLKEGKTAEAFAAQQNATALGENANIIAQSRQSAMGLVDADVEQKRLDASKARVTQYTNVLLDNFKKLGPNGEAAAAVFAGMTQITDGAIHAFEQINEAGATTTDKIGAIAGAMSQTMGAIISMVSAISNARIAAVDKEIAAEQKRDGKSAESVAKLQALEKKKDDMARKQFNLNKKLMMAQAVMATAAGVANALASAAPPVNFILAGIVGAMGAAQIALIASTQYQSSAKTAAVQPPSTLSIGRRSDSVDLARGPNANAGAEAGFLRGSQGMGTNASNFNTIGSAYGGELMRGYGNRGFVVGEKGPEIITPETPINVTPANDVMPSAPLNATINIQALDASGVQDILVSQKGNIIKMLRDAANSAGQGFLEDVNVNVYTRPNVSKL